MQNRWKSKVLWAAIVAQVLVIGELFGLWQAIGVEESAVSDAAAAVLQLLVIVGVVNDPTNGEAW